MIHIIIKVDTYHKEKFKITSTFGKFISGMKRKHFAPRLFLIGLNMLLAFSVTAQPAASALSGQELFKANCTSCHSIGKGRMVGPDLKNVHQKRSEAWLLKWIKSSKLLISSGDADAVAIFNEYNKVPMTEFALLTDDQIKSLIHYIGMESSASPAAASASPAASALAQTSANTPAGPTGIPAILIILGVLILGLLAVIAYLTRVILKLSGEVADQFDNERAFFKKY